MSQSNPTPAPIGGTRRRFLQGVMAGAAINLLPRFAVASAAIDARLVLVILRGALDGLAAVPAYGDPVYAVQRGELALSDLQLRLNDLFALNPAFTHLYERYRARELTVLHAVASPYRERSHFDGQDLLENGTTQPMSARDGWLNRLLRTLPSPASHTEELAVAIAQNIPLVLRGAARVGSWAPSQLPPADSDTLQRIADLYSVDPLLSQRLQSALAANDMASGGMSGGLRDPLGQFNGVARATGRLLSAQHGARIAVIELNGWDTHANQGADAGQLFNRLQALDRGLETLRTSLDAAWSKTAIMVVTEFGRTVAVNGTRGTDHGTATCALLVGGAVAGGKVIADWPGLAKSALYQGRDLQPTLDLRSVFKGVLTQHLGASPRDLEQQVFPDSRAAKPLAGLIRMA